MQYSSDEKYMYRCLELARLGRGAAAPNPLVGAVLVYQDRIIGEGYHAKYGEAHAEVNCINSVRPSDLDLISQSTLYVSLEPCAHQGKTPPCVDLILRNKIPKVVIGCRDPFAQVDGKGIEKLVAAGVKTEVGVLEQACQELNKRFFTFQTKHRPHVILKWAQTADGKMAGSPGKRLFITNAFTDRLVHKWRTEEMAIAVGTNTALADDPRLNSRLWPGKDPVRIVVDRHLRLPSFLNLFDGSVPTIVFNTQKHTLQGLDWPPSTSALQFYQVTEDVSLVPQIMNALYQLKLQSILVEGGAGLLQSFIDEDYWDEARVITNRELFAGEGLPAPALKSAMLLQTEHLFADTIQLFKNVYTSSA